MLWERLRGRQFLGLKFRRQFPVEGFIADFYCHERRLIIELDGGIHKEPGRLAHDQNRDAHLQTLGFHILRFPNERVIRDLAAVLREIAETARLAHQLDP